MLFTGLSSFINQWKSSQGVRQQGANLTAKAYSDAMNGTITEDTLAYRRMQDNLDQVDRHRLNNLNQYNQSTAWTAENARRLGVKKANTAGPDGSDMTDIGDILGAYSEIDPVAGFIGNAFFGKSAYDAGLGWGFNDENKALKIQRSMDRAVQEKFMKSTIKSGNQALEGINKQSGVLAGELTDTAIGNTDKYYAVQSAIDDNGIEGSSNMSRNLDYMESRDNAATQLQYDMIRGQADSVNRNMAESFDQLVQQQEQATLSTLIAPVQFDMAGAMNASQQMFMNQPTAQDIDYAIKSALPQPSFGVPGLNTGGFTIPIPFTGGNKKKAEQAVPVGGHT